MNARREAALCIFAKPPVAGTVKTRLAASLGPDAASQLAAAFLRDSWHAARELVWARSILVTTHRNDFEAELDIEASADVWLQGDGDLGQRLQRVLARALRTAPVALAIGADTPGLPARLLEQARDTLQSTEAVLGPSADGGFYLIGLRRCPRGLLEGLPWSSAQTCARTFGRLAAAGLRPALLPAWFDVDRLQDLARLRQLLQTAQVHAPATALALEAVFGPARHA
jgi:uncharacterized protein